MLLFLDLILEHDGGLACQIQYNEKYVPNNEGGQGYDGASYSNGNVY